MYYYKITKVNKDKTEDEEFIGTPFKLFAPQEKALKEILRDLKTEHSKDNWKVIDYAYEACKLFNEKFTGYYLAVTKFPYEENFYIT